MPRALALLLVLALSLLSLPGGAVDRREALLLANAERFMDALEAGDYAAAHALLAPRTGQDLPVEKLQATWEGLPKRLGPLRLRRPARLETLGGRPAAVLRLEFDKQAVEARLATDRSGRIDGFWLVPADLRAPSVPPPREPEPTPAYAAPFSEREFPVGDLGGTLTVPRGAGPFPAIVLVHGSGRADRDETLGPNKPFLDLAYGLAGRGVVVLRYDKRTWLRSGTLSADATAEEVTIADAVKAVALLRALPQVDAGRVFVLGHSLGGFLAPRIGERAPDVRGLVLMAALSRPLYDAVPEQIRYLAERDGLVTELERVTMEAAFQQRDELRAMMAGGPPPRQPMMGIPPAYWRDHAASRPVERALALGKPMLLLQGERDYQVTVEGDLQRWRDGLATHPDARFITYPDLNHLFLRGHGPPSPEEYRREGRVEAQVVTDIADWIGQH